MIALDIGESLIYSLGSLTFNYFRSTMEYCEFLGKDMKRVNISLIIITKFSTLPLGYKSFCSSL
jgi:hypothetical protein